MYQGSWLRPHTNRLLFEFGVSHTPIGFDGQPNARAVTNLPGAIQFNPTIVVRNPSIIFAGATHRSSPKQVDSYRASATYVTGRHNFKFGLTALRQWTGLFQSNQNTSAPWLSAHYFGGFPIRALFYGTSDQEDQALTWGLYAQDQWTLDRLTLNLGLRWDYVDVSYPDGVRQANVWVPQTFTFPGQTVVTWKDLQPRLAAAYDLSGDGRTALKVSANRYGKRESTFWASSANPATVNRVQVRSWNDGFTGCRGVGCIPSRSAG